MIDLRGRKWVEKLGARQYTPFVPGMRPQQGTGGQHSSAFPRALNTNASAFIPAPRAPKSIVIKNEDGTVLSLEALKKHSLQPPTVSITPPSPVRTSRRTASVRIESQESKRKREEQARLEQEQKDAEELAKKEEKERKRKEKEAT